MKEIKINGVTWKFNSVYSFLQKTKRSSGSIDCVLQIQLFKKNKQVKWGDIKGTYIGEVISREIMSIINEVKDV